MNDGIGLAEVLLGLPGFRVLDVTETDGEVVDGDRDDGGAWWRCRTCGVRAEAQDRMRVDVRDLACFGRPARLVWSKRRWRCREPLCPAQDVDRGLRARRRAGGADPPGRGRGVPPGR